MVYTYDDVSELIIALVDKSDRCFIYVNGLHIRVYADSVRLSPQILECF